jgi:hypothetical protein
LSSSGGSPTKGEMVALYSLAGLLTLISQIQVRLHDCEGAAGCGVSFAKGVAWSVLWPMSWLRYVAGL